MSKHGCPPAINSAVFNPASRCPTHCCSDSLLPPSQPPSPLHSQLAAAHYEHERRPGLGASGYPQAGAHQLRCPEAQRGERSHQGRCVARSGPCRRACWGRPQASMEGGRRGPPVRPLPLPPLPPLPPPLRRADLCFPRSDPAPGSAGAEVDTVKRQIAGNTSSARGPIKSAGRAGCYVGCYVSGGWVERERGRSERGREQRVGVHCGRCSTCQQPLSLLHLASNHVLCCWGCQLPSYCSAF